MKKNGLMIIVCAGDIGIRTTQLGFGQAGTEVNLYPEAVKFCPPRLKRLSA